MSKRSAPLLIADILDSGQKILSYTSGLTFEQFTDDNKTVDAVIRNLKLLERLQIGYLKNSKKLIRKLIGIA